MRSGPAQAQVVSDDGVLVEVDAPPDGRGVVEPVVGLRPPADGRRQPCTGGQAVIASTAAPSPSPHPR